MLLKYANITIFAQGAGSPSPERPHTRTRCRREVHILAHVQCHQGSNEFRRAPKSQTEMSRAQQCDTHSHCCLGPGCVTGNKLPKTEAQTRVGDNCLRPQSARMRPMCRTRQASQTLVLAEPTGGTMWPGTTTPPPGTWEAAAPSPSTG